VLTSRERKTSENLKHALRSQGFFYLMIVANVGGWLGGSLSAVGGSLRERAGSLRNQGIFELTAGGTAGSSGKPPVPFPISPHISPFVPILPLFCTRHTYTPLSLSYHPYDILLFDINNEDTFYYFPSICSAHNRGLFSFPTISSIRFMTASATSLFISPSII